MTCNTPPLHGNNGKISLDYQITNNVQIWYLFWDIRPLPTATLKWSKRVCAATSTHSPLKDPMTTVDLSVKKGPATKLLCRPLTMVTHHSTKDQSPSDTPSIPASPTISTLTSLATSSQNERENTNENFLSNKFGMSKNNPNTHQELIQKMKCMWCDTIFHALTLLIWYLMY